MPKNPRRKGFFFFFFWWKGGSHYPTAKISSVAGGSGGEGETPCPMALSSSLMGKNNPGLPSSLPNTKEFIKEMPSYASRLATSCPQPLILGSAGLRKPGEGLPFPFFFKKQMKMSGQLKNEHKNIKNSDDSGQAVLGMGKETRGAGPGRHLPAHCPSASNPALQEGAPPQSPEAWPEGEGTRAWGLGAQAPPTKPRGRAKGGL